MIGEHCRITVSAEWLKFTTGKLQIHKAHVYSCTTDELYRDLLSRCMWNCSWYMKTVLLCRVYEALP